MKAIVFEQYGSAEVLRIQERERPRPGPGEILVRVRAAEVTKTDCELRSFRFPVGWYWLPMRLFFGVRRPRHQILGGYFSGTVEEVGEGVTRFAPGDAVFGSSKMRLGAYGEYLCIPQSYTVVPKPSNLSFEEAASVPLGGLNAIHFMRQAELGPGKSLLIVGGGGSIGMYALEIARMMGAEVTVVDAGHKEEAVRSRGAVDFVDYQKTPFWNTTRRYDAVFSLVAATPFSKALSVLLPHGTYLMGNPRIRDMLRTLFSKFFGNQSVHFAFAGERHDELTTLADWLQSGTIRSCVDRVFVPEEIASAHRRVETEQRVGCVVLRHAHADPPG